MTAFQRYADYLQSVRQGFPPSAFQLATSEWYFNANDPRCPHDAHLVSATIAESPTQEPAAAISFRAVLSGAHDGERMEFFYPQVFRYTLNFTGAHFSHSDWRYDEFRLSDRGFVLHEIEWCHATETGRWIIEASDVYFTHDSPKA